MGGVFETGVWRSQHRSEAVSPRMLKREHWVQSERMNIQHETVMCSMPVHERWRMRETVNSHHENMTLATKP
eukprot:60958-Rhodomonas_salina.1